MATSLEEFLMRRIRVRIEALVKSSGLTPEDLERIAEASEELEEIEKQMEELRKKAEAIREELKPVIESVPAETLRQLAELGIVPSSYVFLYKGISTGRRTTTGHRGGGGRGKKIVFKGKSYSSAAEVLRELGIDYGKDSPVRVLLRWAKKNGLSVSEEPDKIVIA